MDIFLFISYINFILIALKFYPPVIGDCQKNFIRQIIIS